MKRVFYISVLVFFVSSSFLKEKTLTEVLIGNCWIKNNNFYSNKYVNRPYLNPNKSGYCFINENEVVLYTKDSWCGNATRTQVRGKWNVLNDSTISVKFKNYRESDVDTELRVRLKTNLKVEMFLLFYDEYDENGTLIYCWEND